MRSSQTQFVLERLVVVRSVVFGCSRTWARSHTLRQTTGPRTGTKIHAIVFSSQTPPSIFDWEFLTGKKVIADIRPLRSSRTDGEIFLYPLFIHGFSRRSSFGDSSSLWYWDWKTIPVARPNFPCWTREREFFARSGAQCKNESACAQNA